MYIVSLCNIHYIPQLCFGGTDTKKEYVSIVTQLYITVLYVLTNKWMWTIKDNYMNICTYNRTEPFSSISQAESDSRCSCNFHRIGPNAILFIPLNHSNLIIYFYLVPFVRETTSLSRDISPFRF